MSASRTALKKWQQRDGVVCRCIFTEDGICNRPSHKRCLCINADGALWLTPDAPSISPYNLEEK